MARKEQVVNFINTPRRKVTAVVLLVIACVCIWFIYSINKPWIASPSNEEKRVVIPPGNGLRFIAATLEKSEVMNNSLAFMTYVVITGSRDELQAGVYKIPENSSVVEITRQLKSGVGSGEEVFITFPEGWTSDQVQTALVQDDINVSDFENALKNNALVEEDSFLLDGKPDNTTWEGFLYPDSYYIYTGRSSEDVIEKMLANMEEKITPEIQTQVKQSGYSLYEVVTLASIVEKELRTSEERKIGAGIFLQRLEDGYPLQSDATVNYVTKKKTTQPTYEDLEVESEYNTYKYKGLPPGPICNPSLNSITAVLNPTETEYYYFLTTPEGTAKFSNTYQEHLQKKSQYYP